MDLKCTVDGHLLACDPSISSDMEEGLPVVQEETDTTMSPVGWRKQNEQNY